MKKSVIFLLLALPAFLFSQETVNIVSEVFTMDTSEVAPFLDSLDATANRVDNFQDVLRELPNLSSYTIKVVDGVAVVIRNLPPPNSPENVTQWSKFILDYWALISPTLLFLITALFRVIKKDPKVVVTWFGRAMALVRTRWFAVGTGVALMLVGLFFFNEGAWTVPKALMYFFTTLLGGVGLRNVIDWVMDLVQKLSKKKDEVPAQ